MARFLTTLPPLWSATFSIGWAPENSLLRWFNFGGADQPEQRYYRSLCSTHCAHRKTHCAHRKKRRAKQERKAESGDRNHSRRFRVGLTRVVRVKIEAGLLVPSPPPAPAGSSTFQLMLLSSPDPHLPAHSVRAYRAIKGGEHVFPKRALALVVQNRSVAGTRAG